MPFVWRFSSVGLSRLKPVKRRGNRRYYQHHEVLLIRRIRDLLYEQGFTISGARNRLDDAISSESMAQSNEPMSSARGNGKIDLVAARKEIQSILLYLQA